jgi:hypothetical protein
MFLFLYFCERDFHERKKRIFRPQILTDLTARRPHRHPSFVTLASPLDSQPQDQESATPGTQPEPIGSFKHHTTDPFVLIKTQKILKKCWFLPSFCPEITVFCTFLSIWTSSRSCCPTSTPVFSYILISCLSLFPMSWSLLCVDSFFVNVLSRCVEHLCWSECRSLPRRASFDLLSIAEKIFNKGLKNRLGYFFTHRYQSSQMM